MTTLPSRKPRRSKRKHRWAFSVSGNPVGRCDNCGVWLAYAAPGILTHLSPDRRRDLGTTEPPCERNLTRARRAVMP